jgi:DNA-binding response OmpR family regulator
MQGLSKRTSQEWGNSSRLLIVDDDAYLRTSLRQQFVAEGFDNIFDVGSATGLNTALKEANPDLILLDIQMPDGNGVEICKRLRREGFAKPIVMLTAKNAESDIIEGLEAGANDYVTKPLRMGELLARIHTQLRQFKASDDARFELADLNFVPANKMLHKMECGRMQALTEKETTILKFLYRAFPESVTKDELLTEVWGLQNGLTTHTLETHIYRLRQKIGRLTKTPIVITTENGYRLDL